MYKIRELRPSEVRLLDDFLYEAIFVPEGMTPPPRDIIRRSELQVYVDGFGTKRDDACLVAETDSGVVGAAWVRVMNDYGHVDDDTPSLAIALKPEYRGRGIGTALLNGLLSRLRERGYRQVSLSVQKKNRAAKLYRRVGFAVVDENEEEYIMVCRL